MKIVVSGILAGLLCGSIFAQQGASQSDARTNPTQTAAGKGDGSVAGLGEFRPSL